MREAVFPAFCLLLYGTGGLCFFMGRISEPADRSTLAGWIRMLGRRMKENLSLWPSAAAALEKRHRPGGAALCHQPKGIPILSGPV